MKLKVMANENYADDDFDELPPITVNSATRDSSSWSMPRADELATQRARERHCEAEILRLRDQVQLAAEEVGGGVASVQHSDSSGSEGETALAGAVAALLVRPAAPAAPRAAPADTGALVAALAPLLPLRDQRDLREYLAATTCAAPPVRADIDRRTFEALEREVSPEGGGAAPAAWLCCAAAAGCGLRLRRPRLLRAAHRALAALGPAPRDQLARALRAALPPRALLRLGDSLRCGDPQAEALAEALHRAALDALLPVASGAEAWRALAPSDRYVALAALGRALAAAPLDEALRSLVGAAPTRDSGPDALKALVAASKLQVLFHLNK